MQREIFVLKTARKIKGTLLAQSTRVGLRLKPYHAREIW